MRRVYCLYRVSTEQQVEKSDQAAMDVLHSLIKRIDVRGTNDVSITYFFSSADESEAHGDLPALAASNP